MFMYIVSMLCSKVASSVRNKATEYGKCEGTLKVGTKSS